MEYVVFYGGILGIIVIAVVLIILAESPKIKSRNLSLIMLCLSVNVFATPIAFFIGGRATDPPESGMLDFFKGFLFIQAIPLLLLVFGIIKFLIDRKQRRKDKSY
ncbi:hypothetical protein ACFDTO_36620 [Microbacteriaceae bacterium 4G12]